MTQVLEKIKFKEKKYGGETCRLKKLFYQIKEKTPNVYSSLLYPWGIYSKTLSGCLKSWIRLNITSYSYIPTIKFNLKIRHSKRLATIIIK